MTTVIVGPTAVGKSSLAVELARRARAEGRPAEIVNADSMLVYRGMDIGTAKPTPLERAEVPHHLLDLLGVTETATVAEFQRLARDAIADCRRRGVLALVVGGSALYVRAIVDDFEFPGTDPDVREALERELAESGLVPLHERLRRLDPAAASVISAANGRRVVRALEVIALTGGPFRAGLPPRSYRLPEVAQLGLDLDRSALDVRIVERVQQMWAAGLVEEVRQLADAGLREGLTASRALGYRQVLRFLDGEISETEAQELTVAATRKFARRQDSWFRKDDRIHWLPAAAPALIDDAYAFFVRPM